MRFITWSLLLSCQTALNILSFPYISTPPPQKKVLHMFNWFSRARKCDAHCKLLEIAQQRVLYVQCYLVCDRWYTVPTVLLVQIARSSDGALYRYIHLFDSILCYLIKILQIMLIKHIKDECFMILQLMEIVIFALHSVEQVHKPCLIEPLMP